MKRSSGFRIGARRFEDLSRMSKCEAALNIKLSSFPKVKIIQKVLGFFFCFPLANISMYFVPGIILGSGIQGKNERKKTHTKDRNHCPRRVYISGREIIQDVKRDKCYIERVMKWGKIQGMVAMSVCVQACACACACILVWGWVLPHKVVLAWI